MITNRTIRLVGAGLVLAGCQTFVPMEPEPAAAAEWRGLKFDLVLKTTGSQTPSRAVVRLTNTLDERVVREFRSSCVFWPRVYAAGQFSAPVWDQSPRREMPLACTAGPSVDLLPGESVELSSFSVPLAPEVVLGDSLPAGEYVPGALVRPQETLHPQFILIAPESVALPE